MSKRQVNGISDDDHEHMMERFAKMTSLGFHFEYSIAAAMHHCAKYRRAAPQWLVQAASDLLCDLLNETRPRRRGRGASPRRRYIDAMAAYTRWDLMLVARDSQRNTKTQLKHLKSAKGAPKGLIKDHEKHLEWLGRDWEAAVRWTARQLKNTAAKGKPGTISKSYAEVQNSTDETGLRFFHFDRSFLERVGVDIEFADHTN